MALRKGSIFAMVGQFGRQLSIVEILTPINSPENPEFLNTSPTSRCFSSNLRVHRESPQAIRSDDIDREGNKRKAVTDTGEP
jgi:hypothetical protein